VATLAGVRSTHDVEFKILRDEGLFKARIVELVIITIVRLWFARFAFDIHAE
jgi:hypothetical protein